MKPNLRKSLIIVLLLILLSLFVMIAYQTNIYLKSEKDTKSTVLPSEKLIKIGLTLGTLKEDRWIKDSELLQAKAAEYNVELIILNANNDDKDQIDQVKYLINQDIDVLMIVPTDFKISAEAVALAKNKSIPVISYDRLVQNADVDLYISFDNFKVGQLMAQKLVEKENIENILIINGAKSDYNTSLIKEGYDSILSPYIEQGRIKIIEEYWADNWLKEKAFDYTESILKDGYDIDAILAGNDSLAEGIFEALSEYRLSGKVGLVGQDADLTACQRIVEGNQLMTVYKPINELVSVAIEMCIKLAKGEEIVTDNTINDGTYDVKCFFLSPIPVDISNMDNTIIKDGFHLKSDIYRQ